MSNEKTLTIDRFSTPIEDYGEAIRTITTLVDVREIETKYKMILDDAAECFARITEETFPEFFSQFHLCFQNGDVPTEDWLEKYSAIALPRLFIQLLPVLAGEAAELPSGFVMNRLIDIGLAEIKDGKFLLKNE